MHGALTTFGCVEWESELFSGTMHVRFYPFDMAKQRFHSFNPKVCHAISYLAHLSRSHGGPVARDDSTITNAAGPGGASEPDRAGSDGPDPGRPGRADRAGPDVTEPGWAGRAGRDREPSAGRPGRCDLPVTVGGVAREPERPRQPWLCAARRRGTPRRRDVSLYLRSGAPRICLYRGVRAAW